MAETSLLASIACGANVCWRENASKRLVNVTARCAPCTAISRPRTIRAAAADGGTSAMYRPIMSSPPITTVSRLLKSCATPPVSWPTASIFCAWRSDSSAFWRASFSASSSRVRSLTASSSVSVKFRICTSARLGSVTSRLTPTTRTGPSSS